MNNWVKNIGVWLVIGIVLMMLFMQVSKSGNSRNDMDYSTMMQEAKNGNIESIKQEGSRTLKVTMRDSKTFTTFTPAGGDPFGGAAADSGVSTENDAGLTPVVPCGSVLYAARV